MKALIDSVKESEYQEIVEVWEASVRATHNFLKEEDIQYFKPLIKNEFLYSVQLRCLRNEENRIIGFIGVADKKLEMLFLHPETIGKGLGKTLLHYAVGHLHVNEVDVNEDNTQAVGFYLHAGFKIVSRSEVDSLGKPFPILHLKRKELSANSFSTFFSCHFLSCKL